MFLGNVEVKQRSKRNDDSTIPSEDTELPLAAELLGLDREALAKWATHRQIKTGKEVFTKPLSAGDAQRAVHAFVKHIYAHIFGWIVAQVNASLVPPEDAKGARGGPLKSIGVLDIYGFEVFQINSFEQVSKQCRTSPRSVGVCVCVCVCVCVRARARACVCACVCAHVRREEGEQGLALTHMMISQPPLPSSLCFFSCTVLHQLRKREAPAAVQPTCFQTRARRVSC
jgi:hypothetical protein